MSHARSERPEPTLAAYDELPYDCLPFPQTHPARLAAVGRLFGLATPAVETCRVLELGCGNGNNLIPMAAALPGARFVGVDLSQRQIADGRALIAEAGLTNIELRHADIASIDERDGEFDYVIAHGVYSWVPAPVRDRVLAICRANLAPTGVAYVSYNTLPGWSTNGMIRDMMLYQVRDIEDPTARTRAARELIDFMAGAIPDSPHGSLAREEITFLKQQPDEYLAHDHLGEINDPVYFHQFVEHATRHGLQYLSESELSMMVLGGLAPQTVATMRRLAKDIVAFEQLTDIIRNRPFRQTLLVHESAQVDRRISAQSMAPFAIASPVTVAPRNPSHPPNAPTVFVATNGNTFGVANALTREALLHLIARWPESVPYPELCDIARRAVARTALQPQPDAQQSAQIIGTELLQLCAAGIAELRLWDPAPSAGIAERPAVSRLARLQARRGKELTTLLHRPLPLDAFDRALVPLLDGTRDVATLADVMSRQHAEAIDAASRGAAAGRDLPERLRSALLRLAKSGALMKDRWASRAVRVTTAMYATFSLLMAMEFEGA